MTDIQLLPLPEWTKRDDAGQNMVPSEIRVSMADYARANMEPLQAAIEALRAGCTTMPALLDHIERATAKGRQLAGKKGAVNFGKAQFGLGFDRDEAPE